MKNKIIYILLSLILGLSACSNNSDEPNPTPPPPGGEKTTLDKLIGTWETFYYKKYVAGLANESGAGTRDLRFIDYDGFKTRFWKDATTGEYKFESLNVYDNPIGKNGFKEEGTYRLSENGDTIIFKWKIRANTDTTTKATIDEFLAYPGVMQTSHTYYGKEKGTDRLFKVTDFKKSRNLAIAPNATGGVNPAKEKIDFDEISNGSWEIYRCAFWYAGKLDVYQTDSISKLLVGLTYKFYTETGGKKMCKVKDGSIEELYSVKIVDDLIYFHPDLSLKSTKNAVHFSRKRYKSKITKDSSDDSDGGFWHLVSSRRERDGKDSFIDLYENRMQGDITAIHKTEFYFRRQ